MYLFVNDVSKVNCMHSVVNELKKKIVFGFPEESGITLLLKKRQY